MNLAPLVLTGRGPQTAFLKKNPPLATGHSLGRKNLQSKLTRGSVMCRNSHTHRKTHR
jgi:hypothetical protein